MPIGGWRKEFLREKGEKTLFDVDVLDADDGNWYGSWTQCTSLKEEHGQPKFLHGVDYGWCFTQLNLPIT